MKKEDKDYNKKNTALKDSIKEGCAANFSAGISNAYITPFALKLSSSELFVGIISAISGIIAPISQIFGSSLMNKYEIKSIVKKSVLWQAILWLPLVILGILRYLGIFEKYLIYLFILIYSLIVALGGLGHPAWFSWIGNLVNEKHKGKYFAKRNTILGIFELFSVIIGGIILEFSKNAAIALLAFSFIFILSFVFRLVSYSYFRNMYVDNKVKVLKNKGGLFRIIFYKKEFMKFSWYNLFLNFAIFFASPFFAVYMLSELKFNYLLFMAVSLSGSVYFLLFNKMMGRFSDRYGNSRLLIISNICFFLTPLLWTFSTNPIYLILIPGLITGIANAAMIMAVNNFTLDSLSIKERGRGIAILNLFSGIGIFIGSLLGGIVLNQNITIPGINKFIVLFFIAFVLRFLVAAIFIKRIKEVKKTKEFSLPHVSLIHPFKTIHSEFAWVKHTFK